MLGKYDTELYIKSISEADIRGLNIFIALDDECVVLGYTEV